MMAIKTERDTIMAKKTVKSMRSRPARIISSCILAIRSGRAQGMQTLVESFLHDCGAYKVLITCRQTRANPTIP